MKTSARFALSIGAASALLAGCGGSQLPTGTPGEVPQGRAKVSHADRRGSWMLPEGRGENLVYISDVGTSEVHVYRLSDLKPVGTLTGFDAPQGECSDTSGNVWIVNTDTYQIIEYAHGGSTPIATLNDPAEYPVNCSVDPTTGNLAVMNECRAPDCGDEHGDVVIYPKGTAYGASYYDPAITFYYFGGYDDKGNLFLDGRSSAGDFMFAKLHRRTYAFTNITINKFISFPGDVQWDGKHVTTTPQSLSGYNNLIYRLKIDGSTASVIGTTQLAPSNCFLGADWIAGQIVLATCTGKSTSTLDVWKYPVGGYATKSTPAADSFGTTVSFAPH